MEILVGKRGKNELFNKDIKDGFLDLSPLASS